MEEQLLKDPDTFPTAEVLEKALKKKYAVLREFLNTAESKEFKLKPEWRYYKDGKAWLCKISFKKKTVVWLSVWSGYFKLGFYFTEKSGGGIPDLKIDESIKKDYLTHAPIGKLKPLVIDMEKKSQLSDLYTILQYKKDQL